MKINSDIASKLNTLGKNDGKERVATQNSSGFLRKMSKNNVK